MARRPTIQDRAQYYNMVGNSRSKAAWRFSSQGWRSLMSHVQWEIEREIRLAKQTTKLDLLDEMRHRELKCDYHASTSMFGGAAMTTSECIRCKRSEIYGSTATPSKCSHCAFMTGECQYCDQPISEKSFKR